MISVVIADDHPQVRSGLRHVLELEADFDIVGEAEDGPSAIDAVARSHPDLLIVDYRMPHLNGVQVARQIRRISPDTAIVMLTSEDDERVRADAAAAGIDRYILKSDRADQLLGTLRAVSRERLTVVVERTTAEGDQTAFPPTRIA